MEDLLAGKFVKMTCKQLQLNVGLLNGDGSEGRLRAALHEAPERVGWAAHGALLRKQCVASRVMAAERAAAAVRVITGACQIL